MFDFITLKDRRMIAAKWGEIPKDIPKEVVPMNVADMDFIIYDKISKELSKFINGEVLGYTKEWDEYKESVVKFFLDYHNYKIKEDWIVTTNGVVSALSSSVAALSDEGDEVIIMPPIYPPFYNVVKMQNRKIKECPLIFDGKQYNIDYDLLKKLSKSRKSKILLLCSPHNPSGRVWSREELDRIANICLEHEVIIVSDEIHSDIVWNDKKHNIFSSLNSDVENNSIVCTSASKTFNLAGLQCSNIIIKNDKIREKFRYVNKSRGINSANMLGMKATELSYKFGIEWLIEVKKVIRHNIDYTLDFIKKYNEKFIPINPQAGFLIWVNVRNSNIDINEFIKNSQDKYCYFKNGEDYGTGGKGYFRINVAMPTKFLEANLTRLLSKNIG